MRTLIQFCREHGTAKMRAAKPLALAQYVAWAAINGYLVLAWDEGVLAGVGVGWPVRPPASGAGDWNPMQHEDPDSPVLYVANLCARHRDAVQAVIKEAARRWPQVDQFVAHRTDRRGRARIVSYPLNSANRLHRFAQPDPA